MSTDMHEPTTHDWRRAPLSRIPKGGVDGGRIGGVVAGLSKAYGFDLRTTRIATFIAMIILPVLLLVYVAAWVLLPETPAEAQPIDAILKDRRRMPLLIVIGIVLVAGGLGTLGSWFLFDGAPWGILLVALGVLLWLTAGRGGDAAQPAPPAPPAPPSSPDPWAATFPPPSPGSAASVTDRYTAVSPTTSATGPYATVPPGTGSLPVVVAAPRRSRRPIGSIGVGIAVLWVLAAAALEALGWAQFEALWVIVGALGIVLVALLISTIVNRSWLLPFALFAVGSLALVLVAARPDLDGGSGTRTVRPDTVAAAEQFEHLAAGQLTLDLRDVPFTPGTTVEMSAEVGMGQLRVLVPSNVDAVVSSEVGAGQVTVWGDQVANGLRDSDTRTADADVSPADGAVTLDLRVGVGQISVERVASGS